MSWKSCVWTPESRFLPGAQLLQLPFLYYPLEWGVIANHSVLGHIFLCRHQAGIWTVVKECHNTTAYFHKYAKGLTETQIHLARVHQSVRTHTHTHNSLSWSHSCFTAGRTHFLLAEKENIIPVHHEPACTNLQGWPTLLSGEIKTVYLKLYIWHNC